ncbi:AraC family transcriptional regulator [Halomonas elongata]|uniref:HTH-type transcriptional activator RhaS n=1 Tax=Halomonas elongata TaxID=2746 RepID=A0A1B8P192_HALEL|nr:AraC family transcriptional regulator [Halomonas elongata]MDL4863252.1 AraC family transcriptional regulator [Halomonas elongata]OBX36031.1 HTH-type transcriptional activator RhaS [Halomonas elongata]RAW08234.1 AraC family transcriptional regulator [Halomonas elongata]WVI70204.1 AraC family transcriptional regulator [Halomonas elongata]
MSLIDLRATNLAREHVAHVHGHHQLILATRGATELSIEGNGERITGSRGCLIPCAHHHEYLGDGRNRTFVLDIPVASLPVLRDAGEIERLFERPRFFGVPPQLNRLAESLMQQLEHCPALHSEIAALLLRALYLHLESQALSAQGEAYVAGRDGRLDMARLDDWIDRHLAEAIHVEHLAAQCALSVGHFHARFRECIGMTPLAYVQQRRLEHARTLVNHSALSLGQIAALVGFRDQGSFSRAYRRAFDASPSSERRLN